MNNLGKRWPGLVGLFMGKRKKTAPKEERLMAIGYVRNDGERWVAICLNFNLVAQGENPNEAMGKLFHSIEDYIQYTMTNYPDDWKQRLAAIECPEDFITEFQEITNFMLQITEREHRIQYPQSKQGKRFSSGFSAFAQEIPTALAI